MRFGSAELRRRGLASLVRLLRWVWSRSERANKAVAHWSRLMGGIKPNYTVFPQSDGRDE